MKNISMSNEDYLETIYDLEKNSDTVRSIDISKTLNVSRASVNKALNNLKQDNYITQEKYGDVLLTEKGRIIAKNVREKHDTIKFFLTNILKVSKITAEVDACKIEHNVSEESFNKLKVFLKSLEQTEN